MLSVFLQSKNLTQERSWKCESQRITSRLYEFWIWGFLYFCWQLNNWSLTISDISCSPSPFLSLNSHAPVSFVSAQFLFYFGAHQTFNFPTNSVFVVLLFKIATKSTNPNFLHNNISKPLEWINDLKGILKLKM